MTNYRSGIGCFSELSISYKYNEKIVFLSALNYNYSKLRITDKIGFSESKGYISTSYLTIPLLMKFNLCKTSPISIAIGPYVGFNLSAFERGTTTIDTAGFVMKEEPDPVILSIDPIRDYDNNIIDNYKSIDFGLSTQIDYKLTINDKISMVLFSRFNFGLMDVVTNNIITNNAARKWSNYNLLLGLGFEL